MAESSGLKPGNGSSHVNGKMNGQTAGKKHAARQRRGFLAWLWGTVARLATWAFILTLLFRCPSTLEECDQDSPFICKPYFQTKAAVAPYTLPYYEQFVAPYVDFARPYYQIVNSNVLTPVRVYGGPWVEKGQEQAWAQWEKHGQPQVAQLRALSQKQYEETIAPHLERAGEVFGPYYEVGRTNSLQLYNDVLLPTYDLVQPYAHQGYNAASNFTTGTALPAAQWVWARINAFLNRAVWPQIRMVYVENVEPQLVRIGERLERYKNRARTKVLPEVTSSTTKRKTTTEPPRYSSFSKPSPQGAQSPSTTASEYVVPTPSSSVEQQPATESYWNPVQAPLAAENETEQRRNAREMVAQDLEMWQNKFAAQADEGAADMEDRIDEIANRMVVDEILAKGKPLVKKLQATVESETDRLKAKISSIVAENAASPLDDAQEQVIGAVRAAGLAVKTAAQEIRSWREDYDDDLEYRVLRAADVHFQILDETRNLALQQLGMKWAWTDGVTYKDWAKYHELKQTLTEWTEELKHLIVTHPTLLQAQDAAALVEDDGMAIASGAAKELARLKQVAQWKLVANDATENFDSEAMEKAADAALNPVVPEDEATSENHEQGDEDAVSDAVPEEVTTETADETTPSLESDSTDEPIDDAVVDEQSPDVDSSEELPIVDEASSNIFEHVVEHADLNDKAQQPLTSQNDEVPESLDDEIVEPEVELETPEVSVQHDNEESSSVVLEEPSTTPSAATTETVLESQVEETTESVLESEAELLDEDETSWQQDELTLDHDSTSVKATFLGAAAQRD